MTLAAPWQLAWLLVLPLLWWLSLPPRPRTPTWTAHLDQYRAALASLRRRPPRPLSLRLALLLLAALSVALAAAQPVWRGEPGAERLVVVLDASASMAARNGTVASGWERARTQLQRTFAALPPHVEVTVLRAGGPLRRRHGSSARALHDLGSPGGALAADLGAIATSALRQPATAVWTLTDGQGGAALPAAGALSVLRTTGDNGAVLAVRATDAWPLPELHLEVDVVAFTAVAGRGVLRAQGPLVAAAERAIELRPGEVATVALDLLRTAAGGELAVTLAIEGDVLPDDDRCVLQVPPLPAPRIAVLRDAESAPFATVAAETLAEEVGGRVVMVQTGEPVGLLLVDGGRAAIEPGKVRALCFGSEPGGAAPGQVAPWPQPVLADWDRSLPLTAGLDLSDLRIEQAWHGVLPPGQPFLWAGDESGRQPLAVIAGDAECASVHFAFRLQDSNLPLLAAFPQLLRRAFVRCYGAGAALSVRSEPPAPGELDLRTATVGQDRLLPPFAGADTALAPWCVLAGLLALAMRALLR